MESREEVVVIIRCFQAEETIPSRLPLSPSGPDLYDTPTHLTDSPLKSDLLDTPHHADTPMESDLYEPPTHHHPQLPTPSDLYDPVPHRPNPPIEPVPAE